MKTTVRLLNMFSAIVMLVTGIYVYLSFSAVLSPLIRTVITSGTLLYFFLQLQYCADGLERKSGWEIE